MMVSTLLLNCGVMFLKMTEQQFKHWMTAKTRQYIWLIMRTDPNRVKISFPAIFFGSLKESHGLCNNKLRHIYYRTDYIKDGWDCDLKEIGRAHV